MSCENSCRNAVLERCLESIQIAVRVATARLQSNLRRRRHDGQPCLELVHARFLASSCTRPSQTHFKRNMSRQVARQRPPPLLGTACRGKGMLCPLMIGPAWLHQNWTGTQSSPLELATGSTMETGLASTDARALSAISDIFATEDALTMRCDFTLGAQHLVAFTSPLGVVGFAAALAGNGLSRQRCVQDPLSNVQDSLPEQSGVHNACTEKPAACPQNTAMILALHDVENLHLLNCHGRLQRTRPPPSLGILLERRPAMDD